MATVASIVVNLTASTSQFERALGGAQRTMQGFVKQTKTVTRQLDDIARYGKKAGLGLAALVGSATGLNKLAANHEENMLRVKAVTRATVAEYEAMSKAAIDLSSTTVYSLSQIADGMKFLGMAGFNAAEVMKMMPTVTRLATVGALEMGEAADIATNILAGYQLGVEDLGWATDVLSSAMTGANVDLRDLGEAFKHVGPVAQGAGMEFETTAAAIALLGNAGIQGSIAGTSLKSAISRLLSPSKSAERTLRKLKVETKDTTGKMRAFDDIIEDLGKSGASTANILSIFGLRAGPSMARLVNMGSDAFREYTKRLKESHGIAALIEQDQLQSFNAQFKLLQNQMKGLGTEIGQKLLPYSKTLNYAVGQLISKFRGMSDEQQMSIIRVGALGTALLGLITVFGVVAGAISLFIEGLAMIATVIALVTSPIILALVGISIGVSLMATAWKENWGGIQDETQKALDFILKQFDRLLVWIGGEELKNNVHQYWADVITVWDSEELTFRQKLAKTSELTIDFIFGEGTTASILRYWAKVRVIWDSQDLSFRQKTVKTIEATIDFVFGEGTTANIVAYWDKVRAVWASEELTLGQKVVETIELTVGEATINVLLATLGAVTAWKVLPAIFTGLSTAITNGIGALAAGGLILGKVTIAGIVLALAAGAIGWAFGDKEGRSAFIDAISESIKSMTIEEPITIPIGVMDILRLTFDFGTAGLEQLRQKVQALNEDLKAWEPDAIDAPEWVTDLSRSFLDLGMSISRFMVEGFWLVFDLGELLITAIDKVASSVFDSFKNLGKKIAAAIRGELEDDILPDVNILDFASIEDIRQNTELYDALWRKYRSELPWHQKSLPFLAPDFDAPGGFGEYLESWLSGGEQMEPVSKALGLESTESLIQMISVSPEFDNIRNKLAGWNIELDDFLIKLAMSESDLEDITNSVGARGEFQMMPSSMRDVEKFLGYALDWDDATERAYGSIVFFRMGVENEFATIEEAAKRLGVTFDEALKLWWVAGGGTLEKLNSLNSKAWTESSGQVITYQNILDAWRNIQGFSSGTPFTGWGPLDEYVGLVHRQEAVIPWKVLKKGGLAVLEFLGMPGFQDGRVPKIAGLDAAKSTVETMQKMFDRLANIILTGIAKLFDMIAVAIESLAIAFLGDEKVAELQEVFAKFRKGLEDFTTDVAEFFGFQTERDPVVDTRTPLEKAFDNINWQQPINSFVATFSNGLQQAESMVAQFFGEVTRLIRINFEKGSDGMIKLSLDWEQMLQEMANSLFNMLAESLSNLFSGNYGAGFAKREDPFPNLTKLMENVENWDKNHKRLKKLQAQTDLATIGGAGIGAGLGYLIAGSFGPVGALIGGFLGGLGGRKASQAATRKEIEKLSQKLQDDFQSIKEMLGTTMQDVAQALGNAFSADTYDDFVNQFSQNLENQVRNGLIAAFMSKDPMYDMIDEMSNLISGAVLDGVLDAQERETILDLYSQITDVSGDFYNSLQELGIATGDVAGKMGQLNEAMRNVPSGLKIVANRLGAVGYTNMPTASVAGVQAMSATSYEGEPRTTEVHNHFHGDVYGVDDLDRRIKRGIADSTRSSSLATYGV